MVGLSGGHESDMMKQEGGRYKFRLVLLRLSKFQFLVSFLRFVASNEEVIHRDGQLIIAVQWQRQGIDARVPAAER